MTDSSIILPIVATTSGQALDADALVIAGTTVLRERQRVAGAAATDLAVVTSSGGLSVHITDLLLTVVASSTGGSQPVSLQNALPLSVVASTTGGNIPVSIVVGSTSSLQLIQAASSGGNQPVFLANTLPLLVVASTTGGGVSVSSLTSGTVYQGVTPWQVVASTTGGNAPVFLGNTLPLLVVASTTGGAQPVVQSATPWTVVASTTGGNAPVFLGNTLPLLVVASTTGGAQQVIQSATPWTVVSSTTGGTINVGAFGIVRATQPTAIADAAAAQVVTDTKGRIVITPFQVRQLIKTVYLQVTATGETVLLASSSGTYRDLLFFCITAATSNTVSSPCTIKDSSGGATQFLLNIPSAGTTGLNAVIADLPAPWPQSTATSTGNAWTVNFGAAGVYNVSAMFSLWTS